MQDVIILGAGGTCCDIADAIDEGARSANGDSLRCIGFLDDDINLIGRKVANREVLGPISDASKFPKVRFVNGIGSFRNYTRRNEVLEKANLEVDRLISVIHPNATVSKLSRIGNGSVLLSHVNVGINALIGAGVIILQGSVVSHDATIGDHSILASNVVLAGNVVVSKSVYVGAGALVRNGVRVGEGALIGMGSVVLRDVNPHTVVAGVPARQIGVKN